MSGIFDSHAHYTDGRFETKFEGGVSALLSELFHPFLHENIKAVVLGCTHYPFLRSAIAKALPGVPLFDGNEGTARQAKRVLSERKLLRQEGPGGVFFFTSGDQNTDIGHMEALFRL